MKYLLKQWKLILFSSLVLVASLAITIFIMAPSLIINRICENRLADIGMQNKKVKVKGYSIKYAEGGSGNETLILVHGFRSSNIYWLGYLPELMKKYHVIALDLPGHGSSDRPKEQKYDLNSLGESLAHFIDTQPIKNFYLMGASMGGGVSLSYASQYPERVKKLVLINPLAVYPPKLSEMHHALSRGENLLLPRNLDEFYRMQELVFGKVLNMGLLQEKLALNSLMIDRSFFLKVLDEIMQAGGIEKELARVKASTLIIQSTDDKIVDSSSAPVIKSFIPTSQVKWADRGSHTLTGDLRNWALAQTIEFLSSKELVNESLNELVNDDIKEPDL